MPYRDAKSEMHRFGKYYGVEAVHFWKCIGVEVMIGVVNVENA